jgi:hypothetical protein
MSWTELGCGRMLLMLLWLSNQSAVFASALVSKMSNELVVGVDVIQMSTCNS